MNIGYIGLGIMGRAMAGNLLRAGFSVTVWNRTAAKSDLLRDIGAAVGTSPADVAARSDVVCINVTDTPDVEQVIFGPDGIASGAKAGSIVIDHSTIRPDKTREFARRLQDQQVILLDAPVSGGDVGAQAGTLSIMVGGDDDAYERCMPIFRAVGKNIVHLGESGSGQVCKACNQIAVMTALAGVCEAMTFGASQGLDLKKMVEVVSAGAGGSWQLANLGPKILDADLQPGFMIDLALKDLRIVAETAAAAGLDLHAIREAMRYLEGVQTRGGGALGTQAMIRAVGPGSADRMASS